MRMKKTLLLVTLLIGGLSQVSAQCTIMPSCTTNTLGYCTTPAENTSLPFATAAMSYTTDIQFSLATSIGGGAVTINDATITSVTGMPPGFTYSTNPASGTFNGGSNACLLISGTTTVTGNYTVAVGFAVNTSFGPTTQTLNWYLNVSTSAGLKSNLTLSNLIISPNPATSELVISSPSHFKHLEIVDALGKTVLNHEDNFNSQVKLDISSFSKGIYFVKAYDGNNILLKKFIKE